jgi:hypothetical protein
VTTMHKLTNPYEYGRRMRLPADFKHLREAGGDSQYRIGELWLFLNDRQWKGTGFPVAWERSYYNVHQCYAGLLGVNPRSIPFHPIKCS